jgi:hypothetical protein
MEDSVFDFGKIKVGQSVTGEFSLDMGNYRAQVGCGSCTVIKSLKPNRIEFVFTPTATGIQQKTITVIDDARSVTRVLTFKAEVV